MRITIIGASGHGRVVADIARLRGYTDIVFLDDNPDVTECAGYPVVGDSLSLVEGDVFVAVGDAEVRKRLSGGRDPVTLVHPDAVVATDVVIGKGTVVMAGAVVNPGASIGRGCIVNTCASVDHDCVIADYVHVSVGAHLCGTVTVGESTWIGAGAVINNNVQLCADATIGAGAVVISDVKEAGTYVGVPAVLIRPKGHLSSG
jgi:sugar O-acyltransferase (sialic acid O-acetyltransferase NeuD family)